MHFSSSNIKAIAIVAMTLMHFAYVFNGRIPFYLTCIFYAIGGIAYPIMAFCVSEGYAHTRNANRYLCRLLGLSFVSALPYWFVLGHEADSIFALAIGLALLMLRDRLRGRPYLYWAIVAAACLASMPFVNWGGIGPLIVVLFGVLKGKERIAQPIALLTIGASLPNALQVILGHVTALIPDLLFTSVGCGASAYFISRYDGTIGSMPKLFFYLDYPTHIAILGILNAMI